MGEGSLLQDVIKYATMDPQALADAVSSSHRQVISSLRDEEEEQCSSSDDVDIIQVRLPQEAIAQRNRGIQAILKNSEAIVSALLVLCREQQSMIVDMDRTITQLETRVNELAILSKNDTTE